MAGLFSKLVAWIFGLAALALLVFGQRPSRYELPDGSHTPVQGRTVVTFWEKWTSQEAAALRKIIDRYNLTQGARDHIFVDLTSVSSVDQKLLITVAGGDPPDVCGLWAAQVGPFAESHAILPLDELMRDGTIVAPTAGSSGTYKRYIWHVCAPWGRLFAVSSTPEACALFWNKDLFREAGLPERGPRTIAELDAWAKRLDKFSPNGDLLRAGFLPNEPGWWDYDWGIYFGNRLYDAATDTYRINTPEQVAAYTWYQSYPRRLGLEQVKSFRSGFGQFATPQNAFLDGKVAMEMQGPFFANFIRWHDPAMVGHYGVAPFPCSFGPPGSAVLGDCDIWVVPRGAKHPEEAMKVLRFLTQQGNMEELCIAHSKPSPLTAVSPAFFEKHPNPYIRVFDDLMRGDGVQSMPASPSWQRVLTELTNGTDRILNLEPVEAVLAAKQRAADLICEQEHHFLAMRWAQAHHVPVEDVPARAKLPGDAP